MFQWLKQFERQSRPFFVAVTLLAVMAVGMVDYVTNRELSFSVFYLLAIGIAAWFVGKSFAYFVSVCSVVVSLAGDFAAGLPYASSLVPYWNAGIVLAFYLIVVWLLTSLRSLNRELESRVQQRTAALTHQIAERERLEKELLDISEREQRRIGHDLHDNFCQHLISTAMAIQILREKLNAKTAPEADDAEKAGALVEEGIAMARELARGLSPVELEAEGLMSALLELARSITKWSKVECVFECATPVPVHDVDLATNLYRIAQEAVSNAIRHGKARHIVISLDENESGLALSIEDDGAGLPEDWKHGTGLGTRIMAHRAANMNGTLSIEPNFTGGTLVRCRLPAAIKT